jgi:exodeoxyribonuclease VII large subunit
VVPDKAELIRRIEETAAAMTAAMESVIEDGRRQAAHLDARIRDPRLMLRQARMRLDDAAGELDAAAASRVDETRRRMRELAARLRSPMALVREQRLRLSRLSLRLGSAMAGRANPPRMALERYAARMGEASVRATVAARRERLGALAQRLDAVSPLRVMERGYAVVINARDGRAVADAANVEVGDDLEIRLNRGRLRARTTAREI